MATKSKEHEGGQVRRCRAVAWFIDLYLVPEWSHGAGRGGWAVLGAGRSVRCPVLRAGSVICGGRSWARGARHVRQIARRAGHCPPRPVSIAARAGRRPLT
ncbi:unnamed protein product, partial [Brenthis ino]